MLPKPASILFTGEVRVAAGDINNHGLADIITGAGSGGAGGGQVKVFGATTGTEVLSFLAFDPAFTGGVFVAAGDVTADGFTEIMVGAGEGSNHGTVRGFMSSTGDLIASYFAYDPAYTEGVYVAAFIPEPATLTLLALGALGFTRRRRH